jgi:cytochrome c553
MRQTVAMMHRGFTVLVVLIVIGGSLGIRASGDELAADTDEILSLPGLVMTINSGQTTLISTVDRLAFRYESTESPHYVIAPNYWNAEWDGLLEIKVPGTYRFGATVQGKLELLVNSQLVLNHDSGDSGVPQTEFGILIELPAGLVPVHASFTKVADRPALLNVFRKLPDGFEESILPASFSRPTGDLDTAIQAQDRLEGGIELIAKNRCVACHYGKPELVENLSLAHASTFPLNTLATSVNEDWLRAFLKQPQQVKPHSRMPRLFGNEVIDEIELAAVIDFLLAAGEKNERSDVAAGSFISESQDLEIGRSEFISNGCFACHSMPGESLPGDDALISLDHVQQKYASGYLRNFLTRSDVNRHDTKYHDPKLDLQHVTAERLEDLEHFLMTPVATSRVPLNLALRKQIFEAEVQERFQAMVDDPVERAAFRSQNSAEQRVLLGQQIVSQRGCLNCHAASVPSQVVVKSYTTLEKIIALLAVSNSGSGCLSEEPQKGVPDFDFSADERTTIVQALQQISEFKVLHAAPLDQLKVSLNRLRCTACHERGNKPSAFGNRATELVNLGRDKSLRDVSAPSLDGVGERLKPEYLRHILLDHHRIRPWLELKMPQYRREEVEPLIDLLIRADGIEPDTVTKSQPSANAEQIAAGRLLIGRTGLNCVGCHDFEKYQATGVRAPDLSTVTDRLHFSWFQRWLHNPQSLAPGTRMPNIYHGGVSVLPQVLDGREETQVLAIWNYLKQREGRIPPSFPDSGVTAISDRELSTLMPSDRPVLMHGFLPEDAGLRAVVLGNQAGLHFAWDTEKCQLTRVWQGKFIQQAGWEGSGKGDVSANAMSILGNIIWQDNQSGSVRISDGTSNFPKNSPAVEFEECWSTMSDSGFAWNVVSADGRIRIRERLEPLPAFGSEAFRRIIRFTDVPVGIAIWQRVLSNAVMDHSRTQPSSASSEYLRVRCGRYDWLVKAQGLEGQWIWSPQEETQSERKTTPEESSDLYILAPETNARRQLELELVYVRVASEEPLPAGFNQLLRSEGTAP